MTKLLLTFCLMQLPNLWIDIWILFERTVFHQNNYAKIYFKLWKLKILNNKRTTLKIPQINFPFILILIFLFSLILITLNSMGTLETLRTKIRNIFVKKFRNAKSLDGSCFICSYDERNILKNRFSIQQSNVIIK